MRAVTVYRLDDSSNFSYHTRHHIGSVLELRIYERENNYKDLLRLARRLFANDTADGVCVGFSQPSEKCTCKKNRGVPSRKGP